MRVALVSDTHGFIDPRIADAAAACDVVVHAGDIGGRSVLERLGPRHRVLALRGNNDTPETWPEGEAAALRRLPADLELALPGGTLVAVHGDRVLPAAARPRKLRALYPHARAVVYGHTHRVMQDREALPWILNPGAAGRTRTFGGPSCLILEAGLRRWSVRLLRFTPLPKRALR